MRNAAHFVQVIILCCMLCTLNLAVAPAPANAGDTSRWTWHPTSPSGFDCILLDPKTPTTIYVGTQTSGVFRSRDSGITWRSAGLAEYGREVYQLALSPADTSVLYAACNDGLFRSKDSGATWSQVDSLDRGTVRSVAVDPRQPANLLADVNGEGLFRSVDAGTTWSYVGYDRVFDHTPWCPVFSPTGSSVVFALYGGLVRSTDGGVTWRAASSGIVSGVARTGSLVLSPSNPTSFYVPTDQGVLHSTDSGATWVLGDAGMGSSRVLCVAVDPTNSTTVYAGTNNGVYRSTDGGKSWPTVGLGGRMISALAIDPKNPATVYAGDSSSYHDGISRSADGGTTWSSLGLDGTGLDIVATCRDDSTVFYGASDNGKVVRISDNGATFSSPSARLAESDISCLVVDPTTSAKVFAGTTADGVFRSLDGGRTWTPANSGLADNHVYCLAINPRESSVLYAGTVRRGAFRSVDGGNSWTEMTSSLKDREILAVGIDPVAPTTLFVSTRTKGIFRSRDQGSTWTVANAGLEGARVYGFAIDPDNSSNMFAIGTGSGVYRSMNGGDTWAPASMGISRTMNAPVTAIALDPKDPSVLYVGGSWNGIFRSTDSGATWTQFMATAEDMGMISMSARSLAVSSSSLYTGGGYGLFSLGATAFRLVSTVSPAAGGYVSRSPDLLTYAAGATITLAATPSAGYTFTGWSGDLTGATNPATVAMDDNKSVTATFTAVPAHVEQTVLVLHIGKSMFTVDGSSMALDSPPVIKNGRTLVPIRAIIEALGGTVDWDATTRKATVTLEGTSLELWIGKNTATVNSTDTLIDSTNTKVVPEIINGRTMLPLRFATESLGATVSWEQSTQTITITYQP